MTTDIHGEHSEAVRVKSYSAASKAFHWTTSILVFITWPLGIVMLGAAPGPEMDRLYNLHWSFGATVLTVATFRWLHRMFRTPVATSPGIPDWQARVGAITHWTMYVLLLVVPLLGWAGKSAYGGPIMIFGLFELPGLVADDQPLGERLLGIHKAFALALGAVVVLHVAAALQHHFIRRDSTLLRMLPGGSARD